MGKRIQVTIDNPCHENWDNMTPSEKGRFCDSCKKQVIDFTNMSDAQLASFFKKPSNGSMCGRFYTDQLDHPIELPRKRIPWVKYFFQFALPAFLISMKTSAQRSQSRTRPTIVQQDPRSVTVGVIGLPLSDLRPVSISLKGRVINESNEPVPFASIVVKGFNRLGTSADSSGYFSIDKFPAQKDLTLEISSVGYDTKEIKINNGKDLPAEVILSMNQPVIEPLAVVVVGRQVRLGGYRTGGVCIRTKIPKEIETIAAKEPKVLTGAISSLKIYPNPVLRNTQLNFELNSAGGMAVRISVISMNGNVVLERTENIIKGLNRFAITIDPAWSAGIYFLKFQDQEGKLLRTEKFVVQ